MARQKKIESVQVSEKPEVNMSEGAVLESLQTEIDLARVELEKTRRDIEEKKKEMKTIGRDLDKKEVELVEKQVTMSNDRAALKEKIARQKAYDNVMVTGRFMNRRSKGQSVKLTYMKYEDDPVKWYVFEDNGVYTIPRGFADQINGGTDENPCYYTPKFSQKPGDMDPNKPSSAIHHIDTSDKKYSFVPVNF